MTPLPPSMEKAYHRKCIELRRRLNEIEDANDAARLRKRRLGRSIMKMRLERAFLLDKLARSQQLNSVDDSDRSPSPSSNQDRHHRQRRNLAPRSPPMPEQQAPFSTHPGLPNDALSSSARQSVHKRTQPVLASPGSLPPHLPRSGSRPEAIDKRAPSEVSPRESLPLIYRLPNGTNVLILDTGLPKQAPWTIHDIEPRHHLNPEFEGFPRSEQDRMIEELKYEPFDLRGRPVNLLLDQVSGTYKHIFKGEPDWADPEDSQDRSNVVRRHDINGNQGLREGTSSRKDAVTMMTQPLRHDVENRSQSASQRPSVEAAPGGFTAVNR